MDSTGRGAPQLEWVLALGVVLATLIGGNLWLGLLFDSRPRSVLLPDVMLGATFAGSGLAAWWLRPRSRTGLWMVALGVVMLLANPYGFVLSRELPAQELLLTASEICWWLQFALAAHLILAYPSGRLRRGSPEWRLTSFCFVLAAIPSALAALGPRLDRDDVILIETSVLLLWICAAVIGLTLLARRVLFSPRTSRGIRFFPLVTAGVALALFAVMLAMVSLIGDGAAEQPSVASMRATMAWTSFVAVPLAFFLGLLRERLAFASVGELVGRLANVGPQDVEAALGETLRDPSLRLAFPTKEGLVDVSGRRVEPPQDGSRLLTDVGRPGVAVLVHDPALAENRALLDAAMAATHLALDNARLYAEVRAQLEEVRASRQRLVAAADTERQRLERDLHDGAQQRLLGIGFSLSLLRNRLHQGAERDLVDELEHELRATIAELRDLAQGIRPAVLTDQGLPPALAALARKAPNRVTVETVTVSRFDPVIEATAYYVVSEALQNVVKHTQDATARVRLTLEAGRLLVEVSDDGPGGASPRSGTGLRGLADRVQAVGGCLDLTSPAGEGTTLRAELPCG